jgi:acyl-CoA thioesterase
VTHTPYSELIASIAYKGDGTAGLHIPPDWMQGRTTYGGLSAALCLKAARPLAEGVPLRSAQIAFVGPVGGDVRLQASVLRRGKSAVYISADILGPDNSVATRATFIFASAREMSRTMPARVPMPDVPSPGNIPSLMPRGVGPSFIHNFDVLLAHGDAPFSGGESGENLLWMRHADRRVENSATALLALGDAPPPAAMSMFTTPIKISSMNWSIDILTDTFDTEDNWWLSRSTVQTLDDGYSAQAMSLWNTKGKPVMLSRQTIAVFG